MEQPNNNRGCLGANDSGLTLVELLVATAVAIVLIVMVVSVVGRVSGIWQDMFARTSSQQSARTALEFMTRELQGVRMPVYRVRATDPANPNELGLQFLLSPSTIDSTFRNPHCIFFQAPIGTEGTSGDIAIVGYFVYWDVSDPNHPKPQLRRLVLGEDSPDFKVYSDPLKWLNDDLIKNLAIPASDSPLRGWFVDGVIAIFVRAFDTEGKVIAYYSNPVTMVTSTTANAYAPASQRTGPTYEYDSRRGYRMTGSTNDQDRTVLPPVLPAALEVTLVVVSPRAASRITAKLVPTIGFRNPVLFTNDFRTFMNSLPANVKSGVRVYSTRIQLPSPI